MKYTYKSQRMWRILSFALSVFLRVYWYKLLKKSESEREKLWGRIGQEFRQLLFDLEGLLIKVGQFLSIRADLLPNSFIRQIQDLVDQVPASRWEEIKMVIEKEWGAPIECFMQCIGPKAVASASIGEVYRGKLKDGTEVAVKVQRPAIKSIMVTDFRALSIIIWFADHFAPVPKGFINFKMLFQELKTVIEREVDFKKEMDTVNHFRHRFQSFQGLSIPKTFPNLSTSQVLVMEWIEGTRITDVEFLERHSINREELAQRLFRIFIPQWLEPGIFHADPHAGNVLVKSDGTIILLDFGMVGEISKKDALNFQELIQAILAKNYRMMVKVLIDLGFFLPSANQKAISPLLKEAFSFDISQLKEMDLFQVKKDLNEIIRSLPIQVPSRFIFLGRSFVTIDGIIKNIKPDQELLDVAKPAFIDWLNSSKQSKWKLVLKWIHSQPVFQIFHSITDLLEAPNRYLEQKQALMKKEQYFTKYENQKKQSFLMGAFGIVGFLVGFHIGDEMIWKVSAGIIGSSLLIYFISNINQRKWLKGGE